MRHATIREIIEGQELLCRAPATTVRAACQAMTEHDVGSLLVTDGGRLLGIFTERDALTRVLAPGLDTDTTTLETVMTRDPDTIHIDASVADAIRQMDEFAYRHLPVVADGDLVGILSLRDFSIGDLARLEDEIDLRHAFAERGL